MVFTLPELQSFSEGPSDTNTSTSSSCSRAPSSLLSPALLYLLLAAVLALLACLIWVALEPPCHRSGRMPRSFHLMLRYVNGPPPTWRPSRDSGGSSFLRLCRSFQLTSESCVEHHRSDRNLQGLKMRTQHSGTAKNASTTGFTVHLHHQPKWTLSNRIFRAELSIKKKYLTKIQKTFLIKAFSIFM